MRAAVVIVTHNRPVLLKRTLDSLAQCDFPPEVEEVIVVDNGGDGSTAAAVCQGAGVPVPLRYFRFPEPWMTRARNFAAVQTDADLLIHFDDDVRISRGVLAVYCEAAGRYGPGFFFGGPHRIEGAGEAGKTDGFEALRCHSERDVDYGPREIEITEPHFCGFNWAVFRTDLLAAGGFPPYLGANPYLPTHGGETYAQVRLMRAGCRAIYLPGARVWHYVPSGRRSPAFAVERAYRQGVTLMLWRHVETGKGDGSRAAFGWVLPKLRLRTAGYRLAEIWARLRRAPEAERLDRRCARAVRRGKIEAYRLLRRYDGTDLLRPCSFTPSADPTDRARTQTSWTRTPDFTVAAGKNGSDDGARQTA